MLQRKRSTRENECCILRNMVSICWNFLKRFLSKGRQGGAKASTVKPPKVPMPKIDSYKQYQESGGIKYEPSRTPSPTEDRSVKGRESEGKRGKGDGEELMKLRKANKDLGNKIDGIFLIAAKRYRLLLGTSYFFTIQRIWIVLGRWFFYDSKKSIGKRFFFTTRKRVLEKSFL